MKKRIREAIDIKKNKAKDKVPKRPRSNPPLKKEVSLDKPPSPLEPRKYPTSHVRKVEDAIVNKL